MRLVLGPFFGVRLVVSLSWLILALVAVVVLESVGIFPEQIDQPVRLLLAALVALLFLVSLAIHELAHAVVARRVGVPVEVIGLSVIGTQGELDRRAPTGRGEVAIALAGPLASLAVGAVLVPLSISVSGATDIWVLAIGEVVWLVGLSNVLVGVLNLLPGYPFDGGRLLRGVVMARSGDPQRASQVALLAGRLLAYAVMGAGIALALAGRFIDGIWLLVLGWLLHQSNRLHQRRVQVEQMVAGMKVRDVMHTDFPVVMPNLTVDALLSQYEQGSETPVYPVAQGGALIGAVEIGRVKRLSEASRMSTRVEDVMTGVEKLTLLTGPTSVMEALASFDRSRAEALAVVDEQTRRRLVGLLTREGLVLAVRARRSSRQAAEQPS